MAFASVNGQQLDHADASGAPGVLAHGFLVDDEVSAPQGALPG